jgi:hypothetical protein
VVAMYLHTRPAQAEVNQCSCADAPLGMRQRGMRPA